MEIKLNILFGLSPKAFVHDLFLFWKQSCLLSNSPLRVLRPSLSFIRFGAARHMRRRWTVAISTLILRFPITCSFVFMSNLMAYNSMSNIFTPYNPVFLIPLKVKYKGEPPKTQWTLNSSLTILSLCYFQYLYFVKVFYPNVETIVRRWYWCNRLL